MNTKRKAIIGFGITGQSVCRYLLNEGHEVSVFDSKDQKDIDQNLLEGLDKVEFNFSTNDFNEDEFDLIVASPGVPPNIPVLKRAIEKNISVHTDVTLFIEKWREVGPVVGVTGSNGKTTIVTLIHHYLKKSGVNSILAGNVGNSPLDELGKHQKGTIAILELSSYQLEYFKPEHYLDVCLITNLSSNHLDRYEGKMSGYAAAKMQGINKDKTKTVVCFDDPGIKKYVLPNLKSKEISLVSLETNADEATEDGIYSDADGDLVIKNVDIKEIFDRKDERKLIGLHNLYNVAMSFAVLNFLEVDLSKDNFIREFKGLEHRIELVDEIDGVRYINDSKSTSPDSTRVALETLAIGKNVVLIIGGKDKGMDYKTLNPYIQQFVKVLVLLPGNADSKIKKSVDDIEIEIKEVKNLEEALILSKDIAVSGDVVLLSPGAASPDPYKNFEERGKHFKELVYKI